MQHLFCIFTVFCIAEAKGHHWPIKPVIQPFLRLSLIEDTTLDDFIIRIAFMQYGRDNALEKNAETSLADNCMLT